jgi:hypothetical protein
MSPKRRAKARNTQDSLAHELSSVIDSKEQLRKEGNQRAAEVLRMSSTDHFVDPMRETTAGSGRAGKRSGLGRAGDDAKGAQASKKANTWGLWFAGIVAVTGLVDIIMPFV